MPRRDAKLEMLLAAERLFAQQGIDGVALRHIGVAAGSANNSVVQYHFGTKEGLVAAIIAHREPGLQARREELMAVLPPDSVRAWVECQVRVVMEQAEQPGSQYISFIFKNRGVLIAQSLPEDLRDSITAFHGVLAALLADLPEPLRSHRIQRCQSFILSAAADREHAIDTGQELLPFDIEVSDLVDGISGFMTAPMSPGMRQVLGALDAGAAPRPWLL